MTALSIRHSKETYVDTWWSSYYVPVSSKRNFAGPGTWAFSGVGSYLKLVLGIVI